VIVEAINSNVQRVTRANNNLSNFMLQLNDNGALDSSRFLLSASVAMQVAADRVSTTATANK
jgi:hypothetical protein